ncbi:MAG: hypothetical protein [Caudoviricetes sp.]|nr:MAG: hypothetical protein [Caudoviricetes sp.]
MKNIWKHFKKICIHKYWVGYYCFKAGIPLRGILHDLSKFSPTEFIESIKFYRGDRSPIDACKEERGWSKAWQHHKGRNRHHYEYYYDNIDNGGNPIPMPYNDAVEMLCDYLGAGRAYMEKSFTYQKELEWWENKISKPVAMHPSTFNFIDYMLQSLASQEKLYGTKRAISILEIIEGVYWEKNEGNKGFYIL